MHSSRLFPRSGLKAALPVALIMAALLALAPSAAIAQSATYTVQPGDTLANIAESRGLSTAALMAANNLTNADLIRAGQRLVLPGAGSMASAPAAAPSAVTVTSGAAASGSYTVQAGDTLSGIAGRLGVSAAALMQANGLASADLIQSGQRLVIPGGGSSVPASAAQVQAPAAPAAASTGSSYTVQPGDTLSGIAARFGVSTAALMGANGGASADLIQPGLRLAIPGGAAAPAAPAPAPAPGKTAGYDATRFVVRISQQHCWLYQNDVVTGSWPCSTGRKGWGTATGAFRVQSQIPVAYGSTWDFFMPYWLGIYTSGSLENGIHGLPYNRAGFRDWGNLIGTPISFGCIVMQDAAAKAVYNAAYIGMQVVILP